MFNQDQVARIDDEPGRLTNDEDRILLDDGISQKKGAPGQAEIPEDLRDQAAMVPFRAKLLDEKAHEKH